MKALLKCSTILFGTAAAMIAVATPQEARADDCLLDTSSDGNADSNSDTDLQAASNNDDEGGG